MRGSLFLGLLYLIFFTACKEDKPALESIFQDYYQTYKERKDFNAFLSFYDDSVILEDIISGDSINGKAALRRFFDWDNPNFTCLDSNILVINERVITDNTTVAKGYFSPFRWGELEFEAMHFTTILTFNTAGKIIKQVDWINYPSSLLNYDNRKDSNRWLPPNKRD